MKAAHADCNGDQSYDSLAQNPQTGEKVVIVMNGFSVSETVSRVFHPGWTVAIGDFNGNNYSDIVWYNPGRGSSASGCSRISKAAAGLTSAIVPNSGSATEPHRPPPPRYGRSRHGVFVDNSLA